MVRIYVLLSVITFVLIAFSGCCSSIPEDYIKAIEEDAVVVVFEMENLIDTDPQYKNVSEEFRASDPDWERRSKLNRKEVGRHLLKSIRALKAYISGRSE